MASAGAEDSVLGAVGDVVQQMAQGLARMQEAMRHHFQEAQRQFEERLQDSVRQQMHDMHVQHETRLQEALRLQEQKLQEDFQQHLQAALHQQEARIMATLRKEGKADGAENMHAAPPGTGARLVGLEGRMHKLEESVERALADVVPRVDAVLVHLERQPASAPAPAPAPVPAPVPAPDMAAAAPPPSAHLDVSSAEVDQPPACASPDVSTGCVSARQSAACAQALEAAVRKGREAEVRRLLDAGADANARVNREWTLLMLAAKEAHPGVVALLLERRADVHATTWDGRTALHYAAYNDPSGRCVQLLIAAGANVNSRRLFGATPLNDAVTARNEAGMRALVEAGAIKLARTGYSRSPLDYAKSRAIRRLFQL